MTPETMLIDRNDGICLITLNRPERLNAINRRLADELEDVLDMVQNDDSVQCVILTGAGRAFCAGADIKELADPNAVKLPVGQGRPLSLFFKLEDLDKVVIAAINGPCNGGGMELALCCDFRVSVPEATFGLGEVRLGVIPEGGGTARLPRLIGPQKARRLLYFGNQVNGREALEIGLVDELVPSEELIDTARRYASELTERAPLSLRALKTCLNQGMQTDLKSAIALESKCAAWLFRSEDREEGLKAFVEKRRPQWRSR